jgi:hypothetical protein
VACAAIKVLGLLASGLRERFSPYGPSLFAFLLVKSRDKKAITTIKETLDQLYGRALAFDSIRDELADACDPKKTTVPQCRQLVVEWIARSVPLAASPVRGAKAQLDAGGCGWGMGPEAALMLAS